MIHPDLKLLFRTLGVIFAFGALASSWCAPAFAVSSPWVAGHKTTARLEAGRTAPAEGGVLYAFVQIELEDGWKTYWRTPGDAGGLPPSLDWSKSTNVAAADVMFPAPQRFIDKSGTTIGYHNRLVLPVALTAQSPDQPMGLVVGLHYGICKDICVPIEAELELEVPANEASPISDEARQALDRVPRAQDKLRAGDPVLVTAKAVISGPTPKLAIEARFPEGDANANVYVEAPGGLYLPIPERTGTGTGGVLRFEAPLGLDVDLEALKGKQVTVTLVGQAGASVATVPVE